MRYPHELASTWSRDRILLEYLYYFNCQHGYIEILLLLLLSVVVVAAAVFGENITTRSTDSDYIKPVRYNVRVSQRRHVHY
jgi:hypothetical protein